MARRRDHQALLKLAAQTFGRMGGHARAAALSPEERTAIASKAGQARTKALSPAKRRAIAMMGVRARLEQAKLKASAKRRKKGAKK